MRSFPKRIISLFMAVFVALSCFCVSVSAVESDIPEGNGNMYLDVVFVLDSSGSMLESDHLQPYHKGIRKDNNS